MPDKDIVLCKINVVDDCGRITVSKDIMETKKAHVTVKCNPAKIKSISVIGYFV